MLTRISILTLLATLCAIPALAQPARNAAERAAGTEEIRQDKRERADDLRDLRRLQALSESFDAARASGEVGQMRRVDNQLRAALSSELGEGRFRLAADRSEVRRSNREKQAGRREVLRDAPGAERRDDRRDLRDDRRDLHDDRRDAAVARKAQKERARIAKEFGGLLGSFDARSMDRKRALLNGLIAMAREEQSQNQGELREDRKERREDRRERREDAPGQ